MSSLVSVSGLATGMDTKTLVSQLMVLERQPETILTKSKTKMQSQIDVYTPLQTALSNLQTLMSGMNTSTKFQVQTASLSDSTLASAQASSTALAGTHDLVVTSLAKSQRQVSTNGFASASDLVFKDGGTITISGGSSGDLTVTLGSGNNSLNGIAAAINSSGGNLTASIINDGSSTPFRLVLTGKDTNNYTVDMSGLDDTSAAPTFNSSDPTYSPASNAIFSLDGVSMTRTSNTVNDAIPGVTLNLLKGGGGTSTVTVGNDTAAITSKINSFISSYNDIMGIINKQSVYDSTKKTAGPLFGDSTLRSVKDTLRSIISSPVSGADANYSLLSQIGISTNSKDGTLSLDSTKLSTALSANFSAVTDLFTHNGGGYGITDTSTYGIAERFNLRMDKLTNAYTGAGADNGIIATRINGLQKSMTNIDDQIASMELLLTQKEDNLNKQFAAMESLVSGLSTSGNALINSLSNMPKWA